MSNVLKRYANYTIPVRSPIRNYANRLGHRSYLLKSLQINYSGSDQTADAPRLVLVCAVGRCSQTKNFKVNESPFK